MTIHTTPIHGLQAPNGDDPRNNGDDLLRALVDKLDLLLPRMGDLKATFQTADHGAWVFANGRNNLLRSAYDPAFVAMMLAAGFAGSDGSHFGVPEWRGKAIVGAGGTLASVSNALGATWGEESHPLSIAEIPNHDHPLTDPQHSHNGPSLGSLYHEGAVGTGMTLNNGAPYSSNNVGFDGKVDPAGTGITMGKTGGGQGHNNLQPSRTANIFIFAG